LLFVSVVIHGGTLHGYQLESAAEVLAESVASAFGKRDRRKADNTSEDFVNHTAGTLLTVSLQVSP
jgi:hypothetical protein